MFLCSKSFQALVQELKSFGSVFPSLISGQPVVTCLVIFALLLIVVRCWRKRTNAATAEIPGPFHFPFIGCMYLFRLSSSPHKTLSWLSRIYGNVYSIDLGGTKVIIANSMETIKEVLYQKSRDFAGRPELFSLTLWECSNPIMFKDYNSEYLQQKRKAKLSLQELMNHEDCIVATIRKAIQTLHDGFAVKALESTPFSPEKIICEVISDTMMDCVFGPSIARLFYHEARVLLEETSTMYVNTGYVGACEDFVSVMRCMSKKKHNTTKLYIKRLHDFVKRVYQVYQTSMFHECDNTASLAYILQKDHDSHRLCDQQESIPVSILCEILFNAYEKVSTSFSWCVARLAENPHIQREIQQEMLDADYVKDGTRLLTAIVNEVLRTSCVMPFCVPRRTTRQTTLNGYQIPQGTVVFLNLWSCCNDEKLFSSPQQFNPYRFLSENSRSGISEEFPSSCCFSGGERKCLGDTLTRKFLVSLTEGLLSSYDIELATPSRWKSLDGVYGWTLRPYRYTIHVKSRKRNIEGARNSDMFMN